MRLPLAAIALACVIAAAVWLAMGTDPSPAPGAAGPRAAPPRTLPTLQPAAPAAAKGLTGLVVDAEGKPAAQVEVTAFAPLPTLAPATTCAAWLAFPMNLASCSCGAAAQALEQTLLQHPQRTPLATATTDAEGRYTLPAVADEPEVWLSATKDHQSTGHVRATGTRLELAPTVIVKGVVHDEKGQPVADALVGAVDLDTPPLRTGGDGTFSLRVPASRGRIAAAKAGLVADLAVFDPPAEVTLVLARPVTVRGRVLLRGAPVAGATVRQSRVPCSAKASTAADGTFELPHMRTQVFNLDATSGAFSAKLEVPAGTVDGIVIELKEGALVEGHVFDEHGVPLARARVEAQRDGDFNDRAGATTEPNGHFTLGPVKPGPWTFTATLDGYRRGTEQAVLQHPAAQVELQLQSGGGVRGHVVDAQGQPVAGAWLLDVVPVDLDHPHRNAEQATSRADGAFELNNLAAGKHTLKITSPDFAPQRLELTSPADDVRVTLVPGAFVSGHVLDSRGQEIAVPVPPKDPLALMALAMRGHTQKDGVQLQLTPDVGDPAGAWGLADGSYRSAPLEPGRYDVCASLGERQGCKEITVVAGQRAQLDLTVPDAVGISGFVRDEAGNPISGAIVKETFSMRTNGRSGIHVGAMPSTTTDSTGAFVFDDVEPKEHTFQVHAVGYGYDQVTLQAGTSNAEVRLKAGGVIKGRVVGDDGPIADATVNRTAVGPDGRFVVDRGGSNPIWLRVHAKGYAELSFSRDADREGAVDVGDLHLERGVRLAGRVTDAAGAPIEKVSVFFASENTQTDDQGRFALEHVSKGTHELIAMKQGWLSKKTSFEAPGDDVHVVLSKGVHVSGVVLDEHEHPIVALHVDCGNALGAFTRGATTDGIGAFALDGVPAGKLRCDAVSERAVVPETTLDVQDGRDANIVLHGRTGGTRVRLKAAGSLTDVRLLDGPLPENDVPEATRQPMQVNDDLIWPALPAGRYTLAIPYGDSTQAIVEDINATGSGEVVVTLSDEDRKELGL